MSFLKYIVHVLVIFCCTLLFKSFYYLYWTQKITIMFSFISYPKLRQYIVIIAANLSALCVGMDATWPSPVLVMLGNKTSSPLSHIITDEQGSWIVSVYFLTALIIMPLNFFASSIAGKKNCLVFGYLPRIASAFICLFATNYSMLIVARAFIGVSDILTITTVNPYAAEIASTEIRGSLGTLSQIFSSLGMLIMFCIGPTVSYFTLNLILAVVTTITFVPMILLPESPYFLYSKGRSDEALEVLKLLRESESAALTELKEYSVDDEVKLKIRDLFFDKTFIKATLLGIVIVVGTQLVGYNCVSYYLQTILESTHTNVNSGIASMVVGVLQLLGSIVSCLVIDRFGRRPILISTLIGMAMGMLGLGVFFTIRDTYQGSINGFLNYLPLFSMAIIVLCFNSGSGSSYLLLVTELMGSSYRMLGTVISMTFATIVIFLMTRFFAAVISAIGSAATFYICCINCLVFCAFVAIFVPETKNKSFGDIQRDLSGLTCSVKCGANTQSGH